MPVISANCPYCGVGLKVQYENDWIKEKNDMVYDVLCPVCKKIHIKFVKDGKFETTPPFAWKENVPPISFELFFTILCATPTDGTILELGSGSTTERLAFSRNIVSVENSDLYMGMFNNRDNYIQAPIINGWYDVEILKKRLNFKYDVLLVDGPDNDIRIDKFAENIGLFDPSVLWLFDDSNYIKYQDGFKKIENLRCREPMRITTSAKGWLLWFGD
jgi:hypothetical protein